MQGVGTATGVTENGQKSRDAARWITVGWSIGLALVALSLLSGTFAWWMVSRMHPSQPVGQAGTLEPVVQDPEIVLVRPDPEEVVRLTKNALGVDSVDEVLKWLHPGEADPSEVVAFMKALPERDGIPSRIDVVFDLDVNGLAVQTAVVILKHPDGKPRNRLSVLTPDDGGNWKMDFPAFARLATPTWEEFAAGQVTSVVGRVFVQRDHYYNGHFSDENRWAAYAMAAPDLEELMIGYCLVGSPSDVALKTMLSRRAGPVRATLEIRRLEGTEPRQYAISKVVAEDWVVRGAPFEDRFK
jgi:hypothetical protein